MRGRRSGKRKGRNPLGGKIRERTSSKKEVACSFPEKRERESVRRTEKKRKGGGGLADN